jgi:type VI secretion system Hcp family effector
MKMKKSLARITVVALIAAGFLIGGAGTASADGTLYMKIDNLQGETTVRGREGQTQLNSFAFGASTNAAVGATGGGVGKPSFAPVTVTKMFDSISPDTFKNLATGKKYTSIIIELVKGGELQQTYVRYTFTDSFITSDTFSTDDSYQLLETLSFVPKTFKVEYYKTDKTGKLGAPMSFGFDTYALKIM